jgi:hypothetical protein
VRIETRPLAMVSLACLSACVAAPAQVASPARALQDAPVTVAGRGFMARFVPGTVGTVLTAGGAVGLPGTGVQISAGDLGRDEGIVAKEAARMACTDAGGVFQPQVLGRYPAQGTWVFDGACA